MARQGRKKHNVKPLRQLGEYGRRPLFAMKRQTGSDLECLMHFRHIHLRKTMHGP